MKAMGIVRIIQDGEVICKTQNHMTHYLIRTLYTQLLMSYVRKYNTDTSNVYGYYVYFPGANFKISLGNGSVIPTFNVSAMESLVIDINTTRTIVSDYTNGGNIDIIYTGVIPGNELNVAFGSNLITEMGLHALGTQFPLTSNYYYYSTNTANAYIGNSAYNLIGYISEGGNDFIPANIDTTKTLVVEWIIRFAPEVIV